MVLLPHPRRLGEGAQLAVLEAILVGLIAFVAIALMAVYRLPTNPTTFQQTELAALGDDALKALAARPASGDCNETPCPFESNLGRIVSLALRYEGPTVASPQEGRDVDPLADYFDQAFPDGVRYILYYSNGVNTTTIHPVGRVAPSLNVVVSRTLFAPNWTVHASHLSDSVLVRIGEQTGFKTANVDTIYDPLNRATDEWTATWAGQLADAGGTKRVPVSAVYGTHQLCPPAPAACQYFTIVPPGVFGPGSFILQGDRDNATNILSKGTFYSNAKFRDNDPVDAALSAGEPIYLDFVAPGSNTVAVGDLRLSAVPNCVGTTTCPAGTFVATSDLDVGSALVAWGAGTEPRIRSLRGNNDGSLGEDEPLYLDVDNDDTVSTDDRRLSRVGTFAFGSQVAAADADRTLNLILAANDYTGRDVVYADADGDTNLDAGEAVYLDLAGNGQSSGLELYDLHLSPKGNPTVRYLYDVKVVSWFGI